MKDFLFVFDLDFTLWECGDTWCDQSHPPYNRIDNKIFDSRDIEMVLYSDVIHILEELFHSGAKIAVASRTSESSWAEELMSLHGIDHYFHYREIYPGSKLNHFRALQRKSGIPYEKMIFFDDEPRNIHEVSSLGVNCVLVTEGINYELYKIAALRISSNLLV